MKPTHNGIELRKEYNALRLTLSPKDACKVIAERLLDEPERIRFSISYNMWQKICRDCWQEFRYKYAGNHTQHRCPDCLRAYTNIHNQKFYRELTKLHGTSKQSKSFRAQFYTEDELYHEKVEVEHAYTAESFGEALADVRVTPTYPSKHNAPFST